MREDMAKVITEEPRRGTRFKDRKGWKRKENRIPDDEKPSRERGNLRFKWTGAWYDHKEFGEHLGPLKRFALSCEGRNWDDVYSEICQCIDKGSVTQRHILTHLYQYITVNCKIINGVICENEHPFNPVEYSYGAVVYVDPQTKIIKRLPTRKKRRYKQEKRTGVIGIEPGHFYVQDGDSIWYECWLKEVPPPYIYKYPALYRKNYSFETKIYPTVYDCFLKQLLRGNDYHLKEAYGISGWYCYKKLQLNKREIRRLTKT